MRELSAKDAWRAVLGELQLQLPRPTFETWLKPTEGVSYDEQYFIVQVPTPFAVAWLERRMYQAIQKTVEKITHRSLEIQFQVKASATLPAEEPLDSPAPIPLYEGGDALEGAAIAEHSPATPRQTYPWILRSSDPRQEGRLVLRLVNTRNSIEHRNH